MKNDANQYRERNSGEILAEQQELERLKRITLIEGGAWWEWDGDSHSFRVSKRWEEMTGYDADQVFPTNLSPNVAIESMLDMLCDRWLSFVADVDKPLAKKHIQDFLLFNNASNSFEHGYHLRLADGSYRLVLTTARSVWRDGRLVNLFAQTRDIEKWTSPPPSSTTVNEIVKNTPAVKQVQRQIKCLIEQSSGLVPLLKFIAPLVLSTIAVISANIIPFRRELYNLRQNWRAPLIIDEAKTRTSSALHFEQLPTETAQQVAALLSEYGFYGESIRLAVYDDLMNPSQMQYLVQASKDPNDSASQFPQSVSASIALSIRAEGHGGGQPNLIDDGIVSKYSVAFTVPDGGTKGRLFFVEIMNVGSVENPKDKAAIEAAAKELAARMKTLLTETYAP
jgi:hypothetical protein